MKNESQSNLTGTELPERLAAVGVILRDEKYLVVKRALTETAPGACCFPGGEIEPGESEVDALVRELYEEVGIQTVDPIRCVYRSRTERNVHIAWWLAEIPTDEVIVANPQEVADVYWWSPQEMVDSGLMLRSNLEFLKSVANGDVVLNHRA